MSSMREKETKLGELKEYVPWLQKMVTKLEHKTHASNRASLEKLQSLHKFLTSTSNCSRINMVTLEKMEKTLKTIQQTSSKKEISSQMNTPQMAKPPLVQKFPHTSQPSHFDTIPAQKSDSSYATNAKKWLNTNSSDRNSNSSQHKVVCLPETSRTISESVEDFSKHKSTGLFSRDSAKTTEVPSLVFPKTSKSCEIKEKPLEDSDLRTLINYPSNRHNQSHSAPQRNSFCPSQKEMPSLHPTFNSKEKTPVLPMPPRPPATLCGANVSSLFGVSDEPQSYENTQFQDRRGEIHRAPFESPKLDFSLSHQKTESIASTLKSVQDFETPASPDVCDSVSTNEAPNIPLEKASAGDDVSVETIRKALDYLNSIKIEKPAIVEESPVLRYEDFPGPVSESYDPISTWTSSEKSVEASSHKNVLFGEKDVDFRERKDTDLRALNSLPHRLSTKPAWQQQALPSPATSTKSDIDLRTFASNLRPPHVQKEDPAPSTKGVVRARLSAGADQLIKLGQQGVAASQMALYKQKREMRNETPQSKVHRSDMHSEVPKSKLQKSEMCSEIGSPKVKRSETCKDSFKLQKQEIHDDVFQSSVPKPEIHSEGFQSKQQKPSKLLSVLDELLPPEKVRTPSMDSNSSPIVQHQLASKPASTVPLQSLPMSSSPIVRPKTAPSQNNCPLVITDKAGLASGQSLSSPSGSTPNGQSSQNVTRDPRIRPSTKPPVTLSPHLPGSLFPSRPPRPDSSQLRPAYRGYAVPNDWPNRQPLPRPQSRIPEHQSRQKFNTFEQKRNIFGGSSYVAEYKNPAVIGALNPEKTSILANNFTCIYMKGLPPYANSSHVYQFFEHYYLRDLCLVIDQNLNCRGEAYIHFPSHSSASEALNCQQGKMVDGCPIFLGICPVGILRQAKETYNGLNARREHPLRLPYKPPNVNGNPFYRPKPKPVVRPPSPPKLISPAVEPSSDLASLSKPASLAVEPSSDPVPHLQKLELPKSQSSSIDTRGVPPKSTETRSIKSFKIPKLKKTITTEKGNEQSPVEKAVEAPAPQSSNEEQESPDFIPSKKSRRYRKIVIVDSDSEDETVQSAEGSAMSFKQEADHLILLDECSELEDQKTPDPPIGKSVKRLPGRKRGRPSKRLKTNDLSPVNPSIKSALRKSSVLTKAPKSAVEDSEQRKITRQKVTHIHKSTHSLEVTIPVPEQVMTCLWLSDKNMKKVKNCSPRESRLANRETHARDSHSSSTLDIKTFDKECEALDSEKELLLLSTDISSSDEKNLNKKRAFEGIRKLPGRPCKKLKSSSNDVQEKSFNESDSPAPISSFLDPAENDEDELPDLMQITPTISSDLNIPTDIGKEFSEQNLATEIVDGPEHNLTELKRIDEISQALAQSTMQFTQSCSNNFSATLSMDTGSDEESNASLANRVDELVQTLDVIDSIAVNTKSNNFIGIVDQQSQDEAIPSNCDLADPVKNPEREMCTQDSQSPEEQKYSKSEDGQQSSNELTKMEGIKVGKEDGIVKESKVEEEEKSRKLQEEEEEKARKIKEEEEEKARKIKEEEEEKTRKMKEEEEERAKRFKEEEEKAKKLREQNEEKSRQLKEEEEKLKKLRKEIEEQVRMLEEKEYERARLLQEDQEKAKKLQKEDKGQSSKVTEQHEQEVIRRFDEHRADKLEVESTGKSIEESKNMRLVEEADCMVPTSGSQHRLSETVEHDKILDRTRVVITNEEIRAAEEKKASDAVNDFVGSDFCLALSPDHSDSDDDKISHSMHGDAPLVESEDRDLKTPDSDTKISTSRKRKRKSSKGLLERKRITRGSMVVPEVNEEILWDDGGVTALYLCDQCDYVGKQFVSHLTNFHSDREVNCRFRKEDFGPVLRDPLGPSKTSDTDTVLYIDWIPQQLTFDSEIECLEEGCGYNSNIRFDLIYHLLEHTPSASASVFHCRLCNFMNNEMEAFYDHVASHTGEYRHTCNRCGQKSFSIKLLEFHHTDYHQNQSQDFSTAPMIMENGWPFMHVCKFCLQVYISRKRIESHIKEKHNGKAEIVKSNLWRFIPTHDQRKKDFDLDESAKDESVDQEPPSPVISTASLSEEYVDSVTEALAEENIPVFLGEEVVEPLPSTEMQQLLDRAYTNLSSGRSTENFKKDIQTLDGILNKVDLGHLSDEVEESASTGMATTEFKPVSTLKPSGDSCASNKINNPWELVLKKKASLTKEDKVQVNVTSSGTDSDSEETLSTSEVEPYQLYSEAPRSQTLQNLISRLKQHVSSTVMIEDEENLETKSNSSDSDGDLIIDEGMQSPHDEVIKPSFQNFASGLDSSHSSGFMPELPIVGEDNDDNFLKIESVMSVDPNSVPSPPTEDTKPILNSPKSNDPSSYLLSPHSQMSDVSMEIDDYHTVPFLETFTQYQSERAFNVFKSRLAVDVFKCMTFDCIFTTNDSTEFEQHLLKHTNPQLRCCYCLGLESNVQFLVGHVLSEHSHCQYQCKYCLYRALTKVYMGVHLKRFHSGKGARYMHCKTIRETPPLPPPYDSIVFPYKCSAIGCSFQTVNSDMIQSHAEQHGSNFKMLCMFCPFNGPVNKVVLHLKQHQMNDFQCPYCVFGVSDRNLLISHLLNKHAGRPGKVLLRTPDQNLLLEHNQVKRPSPLGSPIDVVSSSPPHTPMSSETLSSPPSRLVPSSAGKSEPLDLFGSDLYRCGNEKCQYNCSTQLMLKEHLQICDFSRNNPYLSCFHCSKQFRQMTTLLDHIKVHGPKRYMCGVENCEYRSTMAHYFRNHMKQTHHCSTFKTLAKDFTNKDPETQEFVVYPKDAIATMKDHHKKKKHEYSLDDIPKIPRAHVFYHDIKCYHCVYVTKIRLNLIKHLELHKKNPNGVVPTNVSQDISWTIPAKQPVNPVPCLERKDLMFNKMMNLAGSSFETKKDAEINELRLKHPIPAEELDSIPKFVPDGKLNCCGFEGCKYMSCDESMLKYHINMLHADMTVFQCPHQCGTIIDIDSMPVHLKLHGEKLFRCGWCSHLENRKTLIERHLREQHPDKQLFDFVIRGEPENTADTQDDSTSGIDKVMPWRCGVCLFKAATQAEIVNHAHVKHGTKSQYKCGYCSCKSSARSSFESHFTAKHPNKEFKVLCLYYRQDSDDIVPLPPGGSRTSFEPIWKRNDPSRPRQIRGIIVEADGDSDKSIIDNIEPGDPHGKEFACPKCHSFKTPCTETFRQHLCKEINYQRFKCSQCDSTSSLLANLRRHYARSHGYGQGYFKQNCHIDLPVVPELEAWVCKVIDHQQSIINEFLEEGHKTDYDSPKPSTSRRSSVNEKISSPGVSDSLTELPPASPRFKCTSCDLECKSASGLKSHVTAMHCTKYKCQYCPFSSNLQEAVDKHVLFKHPDYSSSPSQKIMPVAKSRKSKNSYLCKKCGISCASVKDLLNHQKLHNHYKCVYCDEKSPTQNSVQIHCKKKHPKKPFKYVYEAPDGAPEGTKPQDVMKTENPEASVKKPSGKEVFSCCHCSTKGPMFQIEEHMKVQHKELPFLVRKEVDGNLFLNIFRYKCGHCSGDSTSLVEAINHWMTDHVTADCKFEMALHQSSLISLDADKKTVLSEVKKEELGPKKQEPEEEETAELPEEDIFKCHICSFTGSSVDIVEQHLFEIHKVSPKTSSSLIEDPYLCNICGIMGTIDQVVSHTISAHPDIDPSYRKVHKFSKICYRCRICKYIMLTKDLVRQHVERTHKVKAFNQIERIFHPKGLGSDPATSCASTSAGGPKVLFKCAHCHEVVSSDAKMKEHHAFFHSHLPLEAKPVDDFVDDSSEGQASPSTQFKKNTARKSFAVSTRARPTRQIAVKSTSKGRMVFRQEELNESFSDEMAFQDPDVPDFESYALMRSDDSS